MPAAESEIDAPPASRLVIRVKLISQEPAPPPPRWRLSKSALLLILGAVAVLLGWLAISLFRSDPTVPPAVTEAAPVVEPTPKPAEPEVKSVAPAVQQQPDAPPSPINEVIPAVSQSALGTITGTIRVSVRVTIDQQGKVIEAAAVERGPSRYFERLAKDASRKWTFTPATSEERRTMLVRFNFTRGGVTAQAGPPQ